MLLGKIEGLREFLFAISLLAVGYPIDSIGTTNFATSASSSAVQAAIDASKNGDTVIIPAGSVTWTTGVNTGYKSLALIGAGTNLTIITNNVSTTVPALTISLAKTNFVTLQNCSFATIPSSQNGIVAIGGSPPMCQFRVTGCKFYVAPANITVGYRALQVFGTYGLIDHCCFRNTSAGGHGVDVSYDGAHVMETNWYISQSLGDTNTVVIEDCVFDFEQMADNLIDVYAGCKFVLRYCTITNTCPGWHGADSDPRGVRMFEVYKNDFYTKNGYTLNYGALARSGSGVMWGNTFDSGYKTLFLLRVYRADPAYAPFLGQDIYLPAGGLQGPCNGSRIVDGNFDSSGWPALDQVGRGSFPSNAVSWRTNFTAAQYESFEGVYQWGNNLGGNTNPICVISDYGNTPNITNFLKAGRDYFDNTPKPAYSPLIYPHPLSAGQTGVGPSIVSQPQPQTVAVGQTAIFTVVANGSAPLLYQWSMGGAGIPGATQTSFSKTNCQPSDNGATYSATVSNQFGSVQTVIVPLTVVSSPSILAQPSSLAITAGQTATFSVAATGSAPLAYQWYFGGSAIGGATQSGYSKINCQPSDAGNYFAVITNNHGTTQSVAAVLSVSTNFAGHTYYVDNSGTFSCADAPGFGTATNPWCTITYALGHIASGDTVMVKNGTYHEDGLYFYGPGGSPGAETTLKAYAGHHPIIMGTGNTGRFAIDSTAYFNVDGFEIYNLNQIFYVRNGAHDITIRNCNIHDSGNELIRVASNCFNILLEKNLIHDSATLGGSNGEGFYIGTAPSSGPDNTHNVTVRSNTVYNLISEGIEFKPGTHDCIAEGNNMYNCSTLDPYRTIEIDEIANWGSNPNHIVRNNIIHDTKSPIRAGTGCIVYNNIIYNIANSYYSITIDNASGDAYPRAIYYNTMDVPNALAVSVSGGVSDIRNNIGPSGTYNLATSPAYFVNGVAHDYHLVAGSAPIGAGVDLSSIAPADFDGNPRAGNATDLGAYRFLPGRPAPPTGLRIVSE